MADPRWRARNCLNMIFLLVFSFLQIFATFKVSDYIFAFKPVTLHLGYTKPKMADPRWLTTNLIHSLFCSKLLLWGFLGSLIQILQSIFKFKMADPRWRAQNGLKMLFFAVFLFYKGFVTFKVSDYIFAFKSSIHHLEFTKPKMADPRWLTTNLIYSVFFTKLLL